MGPLSLTNPWVLLALLLAGSGIFWLGYNRGGDDNEAHHTKAALAETVQVLDQFKDAAKEMNGIAGEFTGINSTLSATIGTISRNFRDGTRANPLPVDCKPDPFRMQSLTAAVAAANTAAGRGAVPAVPPAQ